MNGGVAVPGGGGKARLIRQNLDRTAKTVTTVLRATGAKHGFDVRGLAGFKVGQVLIGSRAEGRVVEANAVDKI